MNPAAEFADLVGAFTHRSVDLKALRRIARALNRLVDPSIPEDAAVCKIRDVYEEIHWRTNKDYLQRHAWWKEEVTVLRNGYPIFQDREPGLSLEVCLGLSADKSIQWPAAERVVERFRVIAAADPDDTATLRQAINEARDLVAEILARENMDYLKKFTPWSDEQEFGYEDKAGR